MKHKFLSTILVLMLILNVFTQVGFAASDEKAKAIDYVTANKIFVGDSNGNLNLESGLTRAELAVLLVRLRGDVEKVNAGLKSYARDCRFTDMPEWAKPSVGYCVSEGLMFGYSRFSFGANDKVTPQQACTVIQRHLGIAETNWNYETVVSKANVTGITPTAGFTDLKAIKRIEMAILIYKADNRIPEPAMTIDEMKAEIVRLSNAERAKAGVPELKVLPELMDCAQAKADDMLKNSYYGHKSPVYGTSGNMIRAFIPKAGTTGENLAPWTKTPAEAFQGWVESSGHYANLINPEFTHIGIGIVVGAEGGFWWIQ